MDQVLYTWQHVGKDEVTWAKSWGNWKKHDLTTFLITSGLENLVRGMKQVKGNTWHGLGSFIYNIGK